MTVAKELDEWTDALSTATGLHATRDPDLIHPPCLFVGLPPHVLSPISGGGVLDLPVYVLAGGVGKVQGDELLNLLPRVLAAVGQTEAETATMTVGDIPFNGYLITVPVRLTPVTPVPPSAPGLPVAVNWKRAEPGWYTFTLTWNASEDEGSSPIEYYRVNIDGNESPTDGNVTEIHGLRAEAAQTANAYVYAVNSETVGPPSETSYLTAPPY